jgi:hypothetical protein
VNQTKSLGHIQFDELSRTLRRLHKVLIELEAKHVGQIKPHELLNMVIYDERFTWLRLLSGLIVGLDEAHEDNETPEVDRLSTFRRMIETLIGPLTAENKHFQERYYALLQQSPDLAIAHGDLKRIIGKLPRPKAGEDGLH